MSYSLFRDTFPWVTPLGEYIAAVILLVLIGVLATVLQQRKHINQNIALKNWEFDPTYTQVILRQYPHLRAVDIQLAFDQLRIYFYLNWANQPKRIAMSSRLVDQCWHVFLLDTRKYIQFCELVFDNYLHHEPPQIEIEAIKLKEQNPSQFLSFVRAYQYAQNYEAQWRVESGGNNIAKLVNSISQLAFPEKIPTIFKIDEALQIEDGFRYPEEFLRSLADSDLKSAESNASALDGAGGSLAASCGDGGACGCGGSV